MSPEYYHTRLTYYEAQDYLTGLNRRHRHTYEAARMVHGVIGSLFAKDYKVPEFPWDKEHEPKEAPITEADIDFLRAEAKKWEEKKNKV